MIILSARRPSTAFTRSRGTCDHCTDDMLSGRALDEDGGHGLSGTAQPQRCNVPGSQCHTRKSDRRLAAAAQWNALARGVVPENLMSMHSRLRKIVRRSAGLIALCASSSSRAKLHSSMVAENYEVLFLHVPMK